MMIMICLYVNNLSLLDLRSLEEEECQGAIIRSKIRDIELGEKSNKYFLNLEKFRQKSQIINSLVKDNNISISTVKKLFRNAMIFIQNCLLMSHVI